MATSVGVSCREPAAVGAPSVDADVLFLRSERLTDPDDRAVTIPRGHTSRMQAVVDDTDAASRGLRVIAQWQSSDTTVVRIDSADSVVTLRYLAPGTSVITAAHTSGGTTRRGAVRLRVLTPPA